MDELARRLNNLHTRQATSVQPSVITGTASELTQNLSNTTGVRIGLWPIVSEDNPEVALGISTILALVLERWSEIIVHRLFAAVSGIPEEYQWEIKDSQFSVDDEWEIDGLNDNVGMWGKLAKSDDQWQLVIEVENDIDEKDEIETFELKSASLVTLIEQIPELCQNIVNTFSINQNQVSEAIYDRIKCDEPRLTGALFQAFNWELSLFLTLWGRVEDLNKQSSQLLEQAKHCGDFGAWLTASELARAFLPGFSDVNEQIPPLDSIVETFSESRLTRIILGRAIFAHGKTQQSLALLEEQTQLWSDDPLSWHSLASLYSRIGRVQDAIDTFQSAIEHKAISVSLVSAYAQYIYLADAQGWSFEELIYAEPDDPQAIPREMYGAYENALSTASDDDASVLAQQVILLAELSDESTLWKKFDQLANLDEDGSYVHATIDELFNVEDLEPGIAILQSSYRNHPERVEFGINLAALYVLDERGDKAIEILENLKDKANDDWQVAEIDRLMLSAEDPDFQMVMGEITDIISAGNRLGDDDIEYLEEVIEQAPTFAEAYVLLGRAYMLENDFGAAIETLLDAEKEIDNDPEIFELLAQALWQSGERELAFQYVSRGLRLNQSYVPLLALAGQYLFDVQEDEAARAYLARAEALAPRHPALIRAKEYIASNL